jgi:hypothetical protein
MRLLSAKDGKFVRAQMPNDAAAEKSGSAEHVDGGPARRPSYLAPHPKAGPCSTSGGLRHMLSAANT